MNRRQRAITVDRTVGRLGCPKLCVSQDHLQGLIDMDLSVPCISKLLRVSVRTVQRRMQEWDISIRDCYSSMTDNELDCLVTEIKRDSSNLGKSFHPNSHFPVSLFSSMTFSSLSFVVMACVGYCLKYLLSLL